MKNPMALYVAVFQSKRKVNGGKDDKHADDLDNGDDDVLRAVVRRLGNVEQVIRDAAHEVAGLGLVIPRK